MSDRWRQYYFGTRCVGAFAAALIACANPATTTDDRETPEVTANLSGAAPRTTLEHIGAGMAVALRDPGPRAWLLESLDRSPYVEHRIPLRRVMDADTSGTVRNMLLRASRSFTRTELAQLPELELYVPIPAHQAAASAVGVVQVAVRTIADSFLIVRADGSAYRVDENYDPGSTVTVVVGRSEIDYDDVESALIGGHGLGR
jgi:hypothetical protein